MSNRDLTSKINTALQCQISRKVIVIAIVLMANIAVTLMLARSRVVLNYDGIFYLTLADFIQQGSLDHPMLDHRGFFYSYLVQLVSSSVGVDLYTGAYLLNAIALTFITFAFTSIVKELGGNGRRIFIISVLIILLFPPFAKYKSMIIRDFVYLAFYLWSVVYLLKYLNTHSFKFLLVWAGLLLIGGFFRIESLLYLILAFYLIAVIVWRKKTLFTSRYKALIFILFFVLISLFVFFISDLDVLKHYVTYVYDYISRSITRFNNKITLSDKNLVLVLAGAFLDVLYEVVKRLDFVYVILAFVAYQKKIVLQKKYQKYVLSAYFVMGLAILVLFMVKEGFISSRYTISVALIILPLCPFILDEMLSGWSKKVIAQKVLVLLLFVGLAFFAFSKFKYSDRYIERTAGEWIVENSKPGQTVISNNSKVLYYSDHFPYTKRGSTYYRFDTSYMMDQYKGAFSQHDYLAFLVDPKSELDLEQNTFFENRFGAPIKQIMYSQKKTKKHVNIYKLR